MWLSDRRVRDDHVLAVWLVRSIVYGRFNEQCIRDYRKRFSVNLETQAQTYNVHDPTAWSSADPIWWLDGVASWLEL